ncbi:Aste57867_16245 [Aphanomyces stellatus]|uniref:Aste57867_16245 protein n=1 Tax=Aphanomyces stellatus TaxID=120398 RepID=A0A485L521_9STRA|nr:hypothetical protein As57867_016188 [Aphanomyces stellatus]VFT93023.1 Aste57867_16245 [Aphanomyces stellatus]
MRAEYTSSHIVFVHDQIMNPVGVPGSSHDIASPNNQRVDASTTAPAVSRSPASPTDRHGVLYFDLAQWSAFRPTYQRNNKKGGTKNLRCFPNCCNGVHAKRGFCGSPITVRFQWLGLHGAMPRIHIVAQFLPLLDSGVPAWATFTILPRSGDGGWYVGDCVSVENSVMVVSINTVLKGWHYGWVSNRHSNDTMHVLCVYALVEMPGNLVECVHQTHTPPFRVFSRRRAKDIEIRRNGGAPISGQASASTVNSVSAVVAAPKRRPSVKVARPNASASEFDIFDQLLDDEDSDGDDETGEEETKDDIES